MNNKLSAITKCTFCVVGVLLAGHGKSLAATGEASERAGEARKAVMEEVIVTATKRDSSLQDTGIAISVIDSDEMKFRDMNNLEDLENSVPGMRVGTVLGTPLVNIRGVGLNFITGLGNPGVATHYDGVYLPRTGSTSMATLDLARVEVLRGPQGTLYGRNATGGSVNFIAKRPGAEFGAGITLGAGDYGREFYEGYIEGPLFTDTLLGRIYLREDKFDGYGINETNGKEIGGNDAQMGRIALEYSATGSLTFYLGYAERDDEGTYPYSTALTTVVPILGGSEYPRELQSFEPYNIKGLREPHAEKHTELGNLTVTWDFAGYTLKSITGYVGHDRSEQLSAPEIERFVVYLFRNETSEAWSQEFNLSGDWFDGKLNWLIGVYYQIDEGATPYGAFINADEVLGSTLPLPTGLALVFPPTSETEDISSAAFLDGYWSILDSLRLAFGIRVSEEDRKLTQNFQPYFIDTRFGLPFVSELTRQLLLAQPAIQTCENARNEISFSSTDPKVGIEWNISDDVMVYTQYQTGFKAGGFDTSTGCNETYEPEEIESYEVGIKSNFFDGGLTLNAAAFNYDYQNYQVDKVEGFQAVIENAAAATSRGFEVEAVVLPTAWLSLDIQYSYLDATYDEYFAQDNFKNSSVLVTDAPVEDLSGNRLSRSPENSVNMGVTVFAPINRFGLGMASFRIEGFYSDDVYYREFNRDIERQEAYSTYNAFLSVASDNEKISLNLFAKNIGDELYQVGQIPFDTVKYRGAYYAPPRTYGGSVSVKF